MNPCSQCGGPVEPARVELGFVLCFSCADSHHDDIRPKGLIVSYDPDGNHDIDIITNDEFLRSQPDYYQEPQLPDENEN